MLSAWVTSSSSGWARDGVGHRPRERDVVRNHPAVARRTRMPQREPHLERAEAAGVLRAVVDVVRGALLEVVVRRVVRERGAQRLRVAHERAARLERRVEPLVRIDRHRVGLGERAQIVGRAGHRGGEPAVRAVDVEPGAVLAADRRDRAERIDGARAHRARPCRRRGAARHRRTDPPPICARSAATSMRRSASTGIQRMADVPRPERSVAFCSHVCVSADAYTRSTPSAGRRRPPRARSSPPARRARRRSRRGSPCCRR